MTQTLYCRCGRETTVFDPVSPLVTYLCRFCSNGHFVRPHLTPRERIELSEAEGACYGLPYTVGEYQYPDPAVWHPQLGTWEDDYSENAYA